MTSRTTLAAASLWLLTACGPSVSFVGDVTLSPNPNPSAPLAAIVTATPSEAADIVVEISDGETSWQVVYPDGQRPGPEYPVAGFRPGKEHTVKVSLRTATGAEVTHPETFAFTAPELPGTEGQFPEFPPLDVRISKPDEMEPGFTLFNPRRRKVGRSPEIAEFNAGFGMLAALDAKGEVVWYYKVDSRISDFEKSINGNIIFCTADFRLMEIDWAGNTLNTWYAQHSPEGHADGIPVDALTFHHEIDELPNGNILVLNTEWKEIDNYYTSEYNKNAPRKRQKVMGDVITEFERDTGKVVWEWRAFEHMDPFRIGYETFSNYWVRRGFPDTVDWSHANNLLYNEEDDSIIVNFRYQAAAMKIDRKTKDIRWIFGEPTGWGDLSEKLLKPEGDIEWPYHQHSPNPTPQGTLLIYNNGNYESRPFTPPADLPDTYSRAVEYDIDEEAMTVRQIWQSEEKGPESVVSIAMGDVDWLPNTQNILVAYGALMTPDSLTKSTWESRSRQGFSQWTRLREYKRTNPPEVVFEVVLEGKTDNIGWTLFGAERIDRVGP